jgi:hypothetical protein
VVTWPFSYQPVAALDEQVSAVGRRHVGVDRRAAATVEERADLRAELEVVRAIELDDVRAIGRQPSVQPEVAARIPEQLVEIEGPVGVAARARDAAGLLLCGRGAAAGGRRGDLVRRGETRVVAIQAAQRVVGAEEPVVGEALVVAELERSRTGASGRGVAKPAGVPPLGNCSELRPRPGLPMT